jgi:hypothetical protein
MSWVITPQLKSVDGVPVGTPYGGGYVAGFISTNANSIATHALIVAPAATGATGTGYTLTTNLAWKVDTTDTAGTTSIFDGVANTAAMVTAGIANHPAAEFCVGLSIGGFSDWYLPSRYELDIAYFNLKPSTQVNDTNWGTNIYSVPRRNSNNTTTYPAQTALAAFNTSAEAFTADGHRSSTEGGASSAWFLNLDNGGQSNNSKALNLRVRAFRRIAL